MRVVGPIECCGGPWVAHWRCCCGTHALQIWWDISPTGDPGKPIAWAGNRGKQFVTTNGMANPLMRVCLANVVRVWMHLWVLLGTYAANVCEDMENLQREIVETDLCAWMTPAWQSAPGVCVCRGDFGARGEH